MGDHKNLFQGYTWSLHFKNTDLGINPNNVQVHAPEHGDTKLRQSNFLHSNDGNPIRALLCLTLLIANC